ncbi:hypothetical protein NC653_003471 [Populus alba x Populus x berolinensis]|uniref:Uncharacterized protein n=1 Tax=Populus alba x Populus x berolinensis TaxID=444605 RepID=A0AAD6RRL2_9ROSI|nr:hypothetical protein NC653_003471 [Populus alba x Populus x berolinensis]
MNSVCSCLNLEIILQHISLPCLLQELTYVRL